MKRIYEAQCVICGKYFKGTYEKPLEDEFAEHYIVCLEKRGVEEDAD